MRMQLQALIRAANGRPLTIMFPFVAQFEEFKKARQHVLDELEREDKLGHVLPEKVRSEERRVGTARRSRSSTST